MTFALSRPRVFFSFFSTSSFSSVVANSKKKKYARLFLLLFLGRAARSEFTTTTTTTTTRALRAVLSLSLAGGRACSLRDQHTQHHHVQRLSLNTKSSPLSLKRFCVFRFALSFHHRTQKAHARNKVVRRSATLFE